MVVQLLLPVTVMARDIPTKSFTSLITDHYIRVVDKSLAYSQPRQGSENLQDLSAIITHVVWGFIRLYRMLFIFSFMTDINLACLENTILNMPVSGNANFKLLLSPCHRGFCSHLAFLHLR